MKSLTYVALEGVITLRAEVNTVHWFTDTFELSLPAAQISSPVRQDETSSVITLKPVSREGPKLVDKATSVASRPVPMRIRPILGML